MHKIIKKLYIPSYPTQVGAKVAGGGGGGGGPSALYTASPAPTLPDANPNTSFRVKVPITGTAGTQVRATIRPGTQSSTSLSITNASIGKWATTGAGWETTATPLELLFGGLSGFTGATTDKTSDWKTLSGLTFTTGDYAIIIYDIPVGGSISSQLYATGSTGVSTYYKAEIQTWNVINPATMDTLDGYNFCIVSLETQ